MTLLAFLPQEERDRLLKFYPPKGISQARVTAIKKLVMRLDEIRTKGCYVETGEFIEGVAGIGLPIIGRAGNVVAALGVCVPEIQAGPDRITPIIEEMKRTSRAISAELGLKDS